MKATLWLGLVVLSPLYAAVLDERLAEANAHLVGGRYAQAERIYRGALVEMKSVDRVTVAVTANLGSALLYEGRLKEAQAQYERALALWESLAPGERGDPSGIINNLGAAFRQAGEYKAAALAQENALRYRRELFGEESKEFAGSLNNAAELYRSAGMLEHAERFARRSVAVFEKLGEGDLSSSLHTLGCVLRSAGRLDEAEAAFRGSLALRESTHPTAANTLAGLAEVAAARHDYAEGERLLKRALEIWRGAFGDQHPTVATGWHNLAQNYKLSGRTMEAEPLYRRALAIWERTIGPDHPDYALGVANLGDLFKVQGKLNGATELYRRALDVLEDRLGPEHPQTLATRQAMQEVHVLRRAANRH